MTFLELAKRRYSSRLFKNRPVEKEKLIQVLEAARIAPSAANKQPWHIIVLREKETLKKIQTCYPRGWLKDAPIVLVICGDHTASWKRSNDGWDACDTDIAIAVDHMTLAAAELGLGTCWICAFDAKTCIELLNLPSHIEPVVLLPLAYPADEPDLNRHIDKRKKLEDIVHWEKFDN